MIDTHQIPRGDISVVSKIQGIALATQMRRKLEQRDDNAMVLSNTVNGSEPIMTAADDTTMDSSYHQAPPKPILYDVGLLNGRHQSSPFLNLAKNGNYMYTQPDDEDGDTADSSYYYYARRGGASRETRAAVIPNPHIWTQDPEGALKSYNPPEETDDLSVHMNYQPDYYVDETESRDETAGYYSETYADTYADTFGDTYGDDGTATFLTRDTQQMEYEWVTGPTNSDRFSCFFCCLPEIFR